MQGSPLTVQLLLCIQVVVSRMRTISNQVTDGASIRILGMCTSLANAKDLGEWIGASSHGLYNFPPGECLPPGDLPDTLTSPSVFSSISYMLLLTCSPRVCCWLC